MILNFYLSKTFTKKKNLSSKMSISHGQFLKSTRVPRQICYIVESKKGKEKI